MCDSLDIGRLVHNEFAQCLACFAALIEHDSAVAISPVTSDQYCHLLATPTICFVDVILASELAHNIGRVRLGRTSVVIVAFANPREDYIMGDSRHDVLMKGWKHETCPCLCAGFGKLRLIRHILVSRQG